MKKNILLSSVAAFSLFTTTLNAQNESLGEISVWETEVISSSVNLGKNSIETKQADHLSDLLRDIPGVNVGGTHSINNRINIRGLQDENLDITIDGAKVQNANMFHHIGNLLINPDILKKANIQVGTNSVINGSLGGSVSFETKDGKDMLEKGENFGARIASTYNSNNSLSGSLTTYGKVNNDFNVLLYHNYVNKNNWEYTNGDKSFGSDGENQNTLLKVSYDINENNTISLSYDRLVDKGDYLPRPNFSATANAQLTGGNTTFDTKYTRDTITLKHKLTQDNLNLDTTIYSNTNELSRYEKWVGRSPRPSLNGMLKGNVKTVGITSKAQSSFETGNILHTLTYGGLYDEQSSDVTWEGSKYGEDESAKSAALYVENTIDFDNGLLIIPGIRYNHYDFDGSYGKIKDNKFTYGIASEYSVNDDLTLLASATTLYKGVEMVDVLDTSRTKAGETPNLKAETGINKEIGFRYVKSNVLGADDIGLSFKYFRTDIKDSISTDWSTGDAVKFNNGDLNLKGYEASFKYLKGDFSSLLTYAHSDSNYENTNEPSDYQPGDSISLNLNYKIIPTTTISWDSIFQLRTKDVVSTSLLDEKDGYAVHNVALTVKPAHIKNLSIIAGIDNIFNKNYISHTSDNKTARGIFLGDYEPGRNIKVTLAYKF